MDRISYDELVEEILGCEAAEPFLLEGESVSPLCIARSNGKKGHGFLPLVPEDEVCFSVEQAICVTGWEEEPEVKPVSGETIDLEFDDWDAWETYTELYPEVFAFAFETELEPEQVELLEQFRDSMQIAIPECLAKIFEEAFPDLFAWMAEVLK